MWKSIIRTASTSSVLLGVDPMRKIMLCITETPAKSLLCYSDLIAVCYLMLFDCWGCIEGLSFDTLIQNAGTCTSKFSKPAVVTQWPCFRVVDTLCKWGAMGVLSKHISTKLVNSDHSLPGRIYFLHHSSKINQHG